MPGLKRHYPVSARINRVENDDKECARAPLLKGEAEKLLM
jgi:hypothetical protein